MFPLQDGRFSVLADILEKSGYINVLRTLQESITILAPSDEAFQKLPESRREKIINDREARLGWSQISRIVFFLGINFLLRKSTC